ncbi:MAG: HAD family phosphatase [Bacteroidota bacterium]
MAQQPATGIAFFDFDKTILTIDSGPIYGVQIYRDGLTRTFPSFKAAFGGLGYKLGLVRRRKVARWGVGEYIGLTREEIGNWMADSYPRLIQPYLSSVVVARIRRHQADGFKVGIITASPPFFVAEAVRDLGLDFAHGSDLQFENGVCTGAYAGKYMGGPTKRATAQRVAQEAGLALEQCWFYSDHIADLPLLEAVAHPVAVGPESKLRAVAEERKWEILEHAE